jgi:GDP-D-mannose dehydratase
VRDFVKAAFAVVDLPWGKFVKYDHSFDRPDEPAQLMGCAEKIQRELGWRQPAPLTNWREKWSKQISTRLRLRGDPFRSSSFRFDAWASMIGSVEFEKLRR